MTSIVIKTKNTLSENDITILVNRNYVEFTVDGNAVTIQCQVDYGLHELTFRTVSPVKVEIDTVIIDNCNIREFVYLGYINANGRKWQPATILWGEAGLEWTLHFITPLSRWIDVNATKFLPSDIASGLINKYHVIYPKSISIDNLDMPQAVKDFYSKDFDYTVIPKTEFDLRKVPYLRYTGYIPAKLLDLLAKEIAEHYDTVVQESNIKQSIDSAGNTDTQSWKLHWLKHPKFNDSTLLGQLPCLQKLIDHLGMEIIYMFIGVLPPGGYIYPHCDNYEHSIAGYEKYAGCTQLYIPVIWPEGCSIKMANAGTVPLDQGIMFINSDYIAHAGLNLSNSYRVVVGIRTTQEEVLKNSEFV